MANPNLPRSPDTNRTDANRVILPLVLILVGLTLWGCFLAFGAYLGVSDQVPSHDPRRAWIMLLSSGSFLLFWLVALFWRARRRRRTACRRTDPSSADTQDEA